MSTGPAKIGIIGCGVISGIYIETSRRMRDLECIALADRAPEAVDFRANMYDIPRRYTPDQLLADPEIEAIINLTNPAAHFEVSKSILEAGKHVYNEKPLSTTREDAAKLLEIAAAKGLRVGCAPDTFLGSGIQTSLQLINSGAIGAPVAATAFMMNHGPEAQAIAAPRAIPPRRQSVTPKPTGHYFTPGIGPMFDMGPYYMTALSVLIGPIRRVTGSTRITWPERPLGDPQFKVMTPSHIAGIMDHESGAISTIITSSDIWPTELPRIEIYGETGSLSVPDPNFWGGPVRIRKAGEREWTEVPLTHGYDVDTRGIGLADMMKSIRLGRPHRASGALAFHVFDAMQGFHDASRDGRHVAITSEFPKPRPMPTGLADGELD